MVRIYIINEKTIYWSKRILVLTNICVNFYNFQLIQIASRQFVSLKTQFQVEVGVRNITN